jgi:hypothetical protein
MADTLLDFLVKSKDPLEQGVAKAIIDDDSGGMGVLGWLPVGSTDTLNPIVTKYNTEGASFVGFRTLYGSYSEGSVQPYQESFQVADFGSDILIDRVLMKVKNYISGADPVSFNTKLRVAAMNRFLNDKVVNGDVNQDPKSFNGIRRQTDSNQVVNVTDFGSYTNGLLIGKSTDSTKQKHLFRALDRLVDYVPGNNKDKAIFMNKHVQWWLDAAAREAGFFKVTEDAFGRTISSYKGITIITPGAKLPSEVVPTAVSDSYAVLPNNYTYGTDAYCTEIYCVRRGIDDGAAIYQLSPLAVETVTEHAQQAPLKIVRLSWIAGFYNRQKSAIAVLKGVDAIS